MGREQKPSSSCCWAPWREWDEEDSLSLVLSRNSLLTFSRSLQSFHMWKWGSLFTSLSVKVCCGSWSRKLSPFSSTEESPGSLAHPPWLIPGLCPGTQRGLSQSKVTAVVSPPSQLTRFLLKVTISMFLIPEAPRIQGNTLCGKGSDCGRVQPYRFHPMASVPVCAGAASKEHLHCRGIWSRQAKHTEKQRGRGNQNVNTVIVSSHSFLAWSSFRMLHYKSKIPGSSAWNTSPFWCTWLLAQPQSLLLKYKFSLIDLLVCFAHFLFSFFFFP